MSAECMHEYYFLRNLIYKTSRNICIPNPKEGSLQTRQAQRRFAVPPTSPASQSPPVPPHRVPGAKHAQFLLATPPAPTRRRPTPAVLEAQTWSHVTRAVAT